MIDDLDFLFKSDMARKLMFYYQVINILVANLLHDFECPMNFLAKVILSADLFCEDSVYQWA